jgi:dolichol-phosphate mannosyltransferase
MHKPSVSIVIPAHNESGNIQPLVTEIIGQIPRVNIIEIIFVDDGSTDNTINEMKKSKESNALIKILKHNFKSGQSAAMITGARAATGDLIVTMDGDGQNDPASIPDLYDTYIDESAQNALVGMVAGQRRRAKFSAFRRFSSWLANNIRATLLGDGIKSACSMRLIRRDIYVRLPYFSHMHRFMVALVQREGFDVVPCPVNHRPRRLGQTKYTTLNRALVGIVDLFGVMWLQRRAQMPDRVEEII